MALIFEKVCHLNSYVEAGGMYFQPTGVSGDRYLVNLSKINVHLCSTDNFRANVWEDACFKIFQTPVTVELELDTACHDHGHCPCHLTAGFVVAAIDLEVTKAHVLHAFALHTTLQEMFPSSSDDEKARKRRQEQEQQIKGHKMGLVHQVVVQPKIKAKLAKLAITQRKQAALAALAVLVKRSEGEKDSALEGEEDSAVEADAVAKEASYLKERGATKKIDVKVIVERLSITFQATPDKEEDSFIDEWSKSVTPTHSLRLKLNKVNLKVSKSTWDTKASVLQAGLHGISVEHLGKDTSEIIDILKNAKHNASMRRVLQTAAQLEAAFQKHDEGKDGSLDVAHVRALLLEMNMEVTDEQLAGLTKYIDHDLNGKIEVAEFIQLAPMLCSRCSLDGVNFTIPLPSDLEQQPEKGFLAVSIEQRKDTQSASFRFGRIELTISSIPLRNAFDWMHFLQTAHVQASAGSEAVVRLPGEKDTQESRTEEEKAIGIAALRASFESESEDIFLPPKLWCVCLV